MIATASPCHLGCPNCWSRCTRRAACWRPAGAGHVLPRMPGTSCAEASNTSGLRSFACDGAGLDADPARREAGLGGPPHHDPPCACARFARIGAGRRDRPCRLRGRSACVSTRATASPSRSSSRRSPGGTVVEHRWVSSVEASSALHDRACDIAGLHIPEGPVAGGRARALCPVDQGEDLQVVDVATRHQGLMVPPRNPRKVYDLADLTRPEVRFINRQAGSGTRFLVERLLALAGDRRRNPSPASSRVSAPIAAVAAYVASGKADAGFGLETAAGRFGWTSSHSPPSGTSCVPAPDVTQLPAMQAGARGAAQRRSTVRRWMPCRDTTRGPAGWLAEAFED